MSNHTTFLVTFGRYSISLLAHAIAQFRIKITAEYKHQRHIKTLFTWSGGPRSGWVGFFCFVSPRA